MSSKVGIVAELMIETNELNRMAKFTSDDIQNNLKNVSSRFGVIKNDKVDPAFNNFKIISGGSAGTISLANKSVAIDEDGLYIVQEPFTDVPIADGILYHIVISQQTTHVEKGTVSVTADGIVTGLNTEFTKVLRGQPHFPTKFKFYNSVNGNTGEYSVAEVSSDTSILLAGAFNAESGLKYSVIGTFTPTAVIGSGDKEIYNYDSCLLRIIPDATWLSMSLIDGKEFRIATALNTSGTVEVKDYRYDEQLSVVYTTLDRDFVDATANDNRPNPLIGVETIKWDSKYATRDKNEVSIAWGFRSTNWTTEPTSRKITITDGTGGRYKTTSQFSSTKFDGWRLYNSRGDYAKIISSVKTGTSINLILDVLNIDHLLAGEQLLIVPDVEEVSIIVLCDTDTSVVPSSPIVSNKYTFPVNTDIAKIYLLVPSAANYKYCLQYQYKRFNRYSFAAPFLDDAIGYYDETSFTDTGLLNPNPVDRRRYPYVANPVNGYIQLIPNPNSYNAVVTRVDTGDNIGVNQELLSQTLFNPTLKLVVGTDLQYQHFLGSTFAMSADSPIELIKTRADGSPLRDGNYFMLHFKQFVTDGGGTHFLRIVQDYVNSSTYTLLYEFTQEDFQFLNGGSPEGIWIRATYHLDANPALCTWILSHTNETAVTQMQLDIAALQATIPTVVPHGVTVDFPSADPAKTPSGWVMLMGQAVLRTGQYATLFALFDISFGVGDGVTTFNLPDTRKRVMLGYDPAGSTHATPSDKDDENYGKVGNTGGQRTHVLTVPEIPSHGHGYEAPDNPGIVVQFATNIAGIQGHHPATTDNTGGGLSHENRQPYLVMVKIMKY